VVVRLVAAHDGFTARQATRPQRIGNGA